MAFSLKTENADPKQQAPTPLTRSKTHTRHFSCRPENAYRGLRVENLGRRFYSPEMGRWASRDPIEEEGGENLYAALRNSSLSRVDRVGLAVANNVVDGKNQVAAWGPDFFNAVKSKLETDVTGSAIFGSTILGCTRPMNMKFLKEVTVLKSYCCLFRFTSLEGAVSSVSSSGNKPNWDPLIVDHEDAHRSIALAYFAHVTSTFREKGICSYSKPQTKQTCLDRWQKLKSILGKKIKDDMTKLADHFDASAGVEIKNNSDDSIKEGKKLLLDEIPTMHLDWDCDDTKSWWE